MTADRPPLPDSYEGIFQRARNARNLGDIEAAVGLYRRLIERLGRLNERVLARRPDLKDLEVEARSDLAQVFEAEGRYAEAIEVTEVLLKTHPEQSDIWRRALAIQRIAKGEVETGLTELHALAEEKPDDAWRWILLSMETRIEGRFGESQAALDRALAVGSADDSKVLSMVHYQRFQLFKEMGDLDQALASWDKALSCDPEVQITVQEVYTMLTKAGRYSEALRYVDRDGNELNAGFQRGLIARLTGNQTKARKEWQAIAALTPTDFDDGYESWMEAVIRLGDPKPALDQMPELMGRGGSPRMLVLAGIALAMEGNPSLATTFFQQVISLLRHDRPPKQKLDSADWRLLDSLVADPEIKTQLRRYFTVLETVWDTSTTTSRVSDGPISPLLRP
jgi:tetratricopeptide (TPR) repeat protein